MKLHQKYLPEMQIYIRRKCDKNKPERGRKKNKRLQKKKTTRNIYSSLLQGTVSKNMLHKKKKSLLKCHLRNAELSNGKASFLKVFSELKEYTEPPFQNILTFLFFQSRALLLKEHWNIRRVNQLPPVLFIYLTIGHENSAFASYRNVF